MKKFLFLLLFISSTSFAQSNTNQTQIKNLVQSSFDEIWSSLDAKNISKYYTKDFILLENGQVWNNDSIANYLNMAAMEKPLPKRINSIDVINIKVDKGRAWVAYHNYATFSVNDKVNAKAHWLESATAILTEQGWRLETLHSTMVKWTDQ